MSDSSADSSPCQVEECRGVLFVYSDGSIRRLSTPSFNVPVDDDGSVLWKDVQFDPLHDLSLSLYKPAASLTSTYKLPICFYIHGGGFCIGSRSWPNYRNCCFRLASELQAVVIAPDYRLAPENRLPAAIEDGFTAVKWLQAQALAEEPDTWLTDVADFSRVFICGESAGGNIAHNVAVKLGPGSQELAPVQVKGYFLLAPFFGGTARTKSEAEGPKDTFLNLDLIDRYWRLSLPIGDTADHPVVNPFGPRSLSLEEVKFYPILVVVGGGDLLKDRVEDYAKRLKAWGNKIEYVEFPEQQHGFFIFHPNSQPSNQLMRIIKRYVGRLFVKSTGKPVEYLAKLNEMAGYADDEEIELYEVVHFRSLEKPKEDDFCLEMSKLFTYDDVVERVAQQLGLDDPSKIRLTSHNCYSQQPKPQPIKYRSIDHLEDMLIHYNQTSDILYYEVLDIPLPELQCLKTLKVAFHHAVKDEVSIHTIRLPKQSTVGDVINDLKTKVELSHPDAELRLLEVFYHKIYKIFPLNEKIENINDQYWTLRAEEIPEEEKNLGPHDRLIHIYHFTKDTAQNQMQIQNFGEPFLLVIHEGETLEEIKVRIQKKLQVPDDEFAKWKFAFLSLGRPEYLQDSDVVSSRFQRRDVYGAWEQYLGLEHSDSTPRRA